MRDIRTGFDYAIHSAREAAQRGDINKVGRQLAAAHALALWADVSLLEEYQRQDAEIWREYEQCKTTTAA